MKKEYWLIKRSSVEYRNSPKIIDTSYANNILEAIRIFEGRNDILELSKTSKLLIAESVISR